MKYFRDINIQSLKNKFGKTNGFAHVNLILESGEKGISYVTIYKQAKEEYYTFDIKYKSHNEQTSFKLLYDSPEVYNELVGCVKAIEFQIENNTSFRIFYSKNELTTNYVFETMFKSTT